MVGMRTRPAVYSTISSVARSTSATTRSMACIRLLLSKEVPDTELDFAARQIRDRRSEGRTGHRVDVRHVVAVDDVERLDEHAGRVAADRDSLLDAQIDVRV